MIIFYCKHIESKLNNMKNSKNKIFLIILSIFTLTSFLTSNSSKLFIENSTGSSEFEYKTLNYSDGTVHDHLHISFGNIPNGKPIIIEDMGRIALGTVDPCLHFYGNTNDETYLAVEGNAWKTDDGMWSYGSDKRLKENITLLQTNRDKFLNVNLYRFTYKKSGLTRFGIIADEVKDDFPHSMGTFWEGGVEYLSFNPNNLFYMGMKVIQENSLEIIQQAEKIKSIEENNQQLLVELKAERERNNHLEEEMTGIKGALAYLGVDYSEFIPSSDQIDNWKLHQNSPNPFSGSTSIAYQLPENVNTASLIMHDMTGKAISKSILLVKAGEGKIKIDTKKYNMANGNYTYSLYVNNQLIDTKKMSLVGR